MRFRLLLSFTLIVLVAVGSMAWLAGQQSVKEVRTFMYRGGMYGADGLVGMLEDYYATHGSWQGVEGILPRSRHGMPGAGQGNGRGAGAGSTGMTGFGMMNQRLRLADADGNLVADTQSGTPAGQLSRSELESAIELIYQDHTVGFLLPEGGMAFSGASEQILVRRLSWAAITAGLIAGGVALLLGLFLAYTLLRPVHDLMQAASHLGAGDLSQRVPVRGNDELASLAGAFNHMADSLQEAESGRRAMTADIAHELRTPLAVQRANLEALQDGIYPLNAENLQPVLDQNVLLTRLVEDLRTLALVDAGQLTLEKAETDLPALAGRVVERFRPQADARGVVLDFENFASTMPALQLDPLRMEQILNNLLSNALRYTPEGGRVSVSLSISKTAQPLARLFQLVVRDTGPGITAEALPHVFERFYRADRSRSRAEGGSGLGLAIARRLAEAQGGTLNAANHPDGGALFTLSFPV